MKLRPSARLALAGIAVGLVGLYWFLNHKAGWQVGAWAVELGALMTGWFWYDR